jgi:hypothetical protein
VLVVVACLFAALFGRLWFLQGVEAGTPAVAQVAAQGIVTATACCWPATASNRW